MSQNYSDSVEIAREYYNSEDADNFYSLIWGGEDIHIGLYEKPDESITQASRRTVVNMAEQLELDADKKVLDIGAGYAGSARYLAETFGCRVDALNLSERENQRARELNRERGLADRIQVVDGSFEMIPARDALYDVVWSQDAMLHSGDRQRVLTEVARVLRPGGQFIFTDPMQTDDCPPGVLQPILDRIHLSSLGSPGFYRQELRALGFSEVSFLDYTPMLSRHYARVRDELIQKQSELEGKVSRDYLERMKKGLGYWVNGGEQGNLCWGIFLFRK